MAGAVIVAGARTPIGKLTGSLAGFAATELGGIAISAALERAGLAGDQIEYVLMGQVLQAGAGQIPARQAALNGGIPLTVPAMTVNKVCLSGLNSIVLADQLIAAGEFEVAVAGGMESMTQAPHLLQGSRGGFRFGDVTMRDHMAYDGLFCAFDQLVMGVAVERHNATLDITRAEQDRYAARSHELASAAHKDGKFDDEIVPVAVPQRRGEPSLVTQDEGVRADTTFESLSALLPAFAPDGTITAGSASQISDGACALVVTSRAAAERLGLPILAEVVGHGMIAGPDTSLHSKPSAAISKALERTGLDVSDLDLVEINEAFSSVVIKSTRDLGIDPEIVNVDGGAISLGHPIGMSGARLVLHLALELRRRGGGLGAAALCGGGGQGDAILIRVPAQ